MIRDLFFERNKKIDFKKERNYISGSAESNDEEISYFIWNKKYRTAGESPTDYYKRISQCLANNPDTLRVLKTAVDTLLTDKEKEYLSQNFAPNDSPQGYLDPENIGNTIYDIMATHSFLPAGRIQYTIGTKRENTTMSNCFVMPDVPDNMEGIMKILSDAAMTMKAGGGVGYYFGKLRPRYAPTITTIGSSSGPVSFMKIFDSMCQTIESAGGRRGAQIAILPVWHPDVLDFIVAKRGSLNNSLTNFNISVGVTDKFMEALEAGEDWDLVFPNYEDYKEQYDEHWSNIDKIEDWVDLLGVPSEKALKVYKTLPARELWDAVLKNAYDFAEPGVVFLDKINENSPLNYTEFIHATNPCVTGDTLVETTEGRIPIKNLVGRTNCKVYCMKDNSKLVISTAKDIRLTRKLAPLFFIKTESTQLTCTPDHKIFVKKAGYIKAEELSLNDSILIKKNGDLYFTQEKITFLSPLGVTADVYDMEVPEHHNFLANGMVIHNCGEQPLPGYGSCNLGHINLTKIVDKPFQSSSVGVDTTLLKLLTIVGVVYLDHILDINHYPLEEQKDYELSTRVIGLGVTGVGDMLAMLMVKYGEDDSANIIDFVTRVIRDTAYFTSAILALHLGSYPKFNFEEFSNTKYAKENLTDNHTIFNSDGILDKETNLLDVIRKCGLRNGRLLTIAPTGTTSLVANNISSGIEPIFDLLMKRTVIIDGLKDEKKDIIIPDYAVLVYKEVTGIDLLQETDAENIPDYFSCSNQLYTAAHIRIQSIMQQYIDGSISKTINVPTLLPFEDFKNIYTFAYKNGLKGITTFRMNPNFTGILQSAKEEKVEVKSQETIGETKKAPDICKSIRFKEKGENNENVYINITYDEVTKKPLEIFATLPKRSGETSGKFSYKLYFERKNQWDVICRLISLGMRSDISLVEIKKQLEKATFSTFDLSSVLLKVLNKFTSISDYKDETSPTADKDAKESISIVAYDEGNKELCPSCKVGTLIRKDGCKVCNNCSYSPCD